MAANIKSVHMLSGRCRAMCAQRTAPKSHVRAMCTAHRLGWAGPAGPRALKPQECCPEPPAYSPLCIHFVSTLSPLHHLGIPTTPHLYPLCIPQPQQGTVWAAPAHLQRLQLERPQLEQLAGVGCVALVVGGARHRRGGLCQGENKQRSKGVLI